MSYKLLQVLLFIHIFEIDEIENNYAWFYMYVYWPGGEHHATDSQVDDAKKLATVSEDFEPRPSVTAYVKQDSVRHDFEPRPSATAYVKQDSSRENFEPRPSITAYVNEMGTTTSVMSKRDEEEEAAKPALLNSFEPRPNVSSYHDGDTSVVVVIEEKQPKMEKEEDDRVSNTSFEPRPNVSAYGG